MTNAANLGWQQLSQSVQGLLATGRDRTPPTIFAPWVTPENPGGKKWGQGCLLDAPREGVVHTFISDISGRRPRHPGVAGRRPRRAACRWTTVAHIPHETGAAITANYYTAALPVGAGDVRYFIEAEDGRGSVARSALERIYLA